MQLDPPNCQQLFMRSASVNFVFEHAWMMSQSQHGRYQRILWTNDVLNHVIEAFNFEIIKRHIVLKVVRAKTILKKLGFVLSFFFVFFLGGGGGQHKLIWRMDSKIMRVFAFISSERKHFSVPIFRLINSQAVECFSVWSQQWLLIKQNICFNTINRYIKRFNGKGSVWECPASYC